MRWAQHARDGGVKHTCDADRAFSGLCEASEQSILNVCF